MKKITVVLTAIFLAIFFSGCELDTTDQFDIDKKEILTSSRWYDIDKNADTYTISRFTDGTVVQDFYTDASFREIAYTKHYTIDYSGDRIYLTDEYGRHICKYSSCEDDDWMVISCDADQPYVKGWKTRSQAASHTPR